MGWDFAAELRKWGPQSPPVATGGLAAARAYCAYVTRTHYENFTVASLLLPRRLVPHFQAVYAYCRWADDLADETPAGDTALSLLGWWRGELMAVYAGGARHPVMVALRDTVRRFAIPPEPFLDLLTAFGQDQRVREYDTFDQLLGYCRNSANPVGRLVLHLFGVCTPDRVAWSDEICTGLQLANFWQDVARDLDIGRVYLPAEDRRRFGFGDADLAAKRFTPALAELMRFEVARARGFFDRGEPLLATLPPAARIDVRLFAAGGRAVLDAIERHGYDVFARRPVVSGRRKLGLLLQAVATSLRP